MKAFNILIITEKLNNSKLKRFNVFQAGFTIVELTVVITVIAILAGVVIIGYDGATKKTHESAVKSDLQQAVAKLKSDLMTSEQYPDTYSGGAVLESDKTIFSYMKYSPSSFCIEGVSVKYNAITYYSREDGVVSEGSCPLVIATTMQEMTPGQCANLPVYTGANPKAVVSLEDRRGEATRIYEVAKLADNNCWMLTNLKLGSLTSTTELTSADTNLASGTTFTLPQAGTDPINNDLPRAYGPVDDDTGSGETNYGYLYNWPAATAGETTTTMPGDGTNNNIAPYSICPAGWRLPTGNTGGDFSVLDVAFGGTGATASGGPSRSSWLFTGPFKGVFSGVRAGSFGGQGTYGSFWSSSSHSSGVNGGSFYANFYSSHINPGTSNSYRYGGFAVRCLLN